MPLTVGSLFAGYGGLDLGLDRALSTRLAWVSEIEPAPSRILAHRFPHAPNLGDVTKVDWSRVEPVDAIIGGSPCQDLSHAGMRQGMMPGTRSGLWAAMARAVEIIRPGLVVWENVKGALSAEASCDVEPCQGCLGVTRDPVPAMRALGRVLGDLAVLGYDAAWYGLPAAAVGACHSRFRVFVVAAPTDAHNPGWREHRRPLTVQPELIAAERTGDPILTLLPTPAVNDMGEGKTLEWWDEWAPRQRSSTGTPAPHGKSLAIEAQRLLPTPFAGLGEHNRANGVDPSKRRAQGRQISVADVARHELPPDWGDYAASITRHERAFGRRAPAPTAPGGSALSPRFVEWMMGLEDGWVTGVPGITRNAALKALGNGVVPKQAAAAIDHCLNMLDTRWLA